MRWDIELSYRITPKSGPLRSMTTLMDANQALTQDLPIGWLRRPHWAVAARLLLSAAEGGQSKNVAALTEALLSAVTREGRMERLPPARAAKE